MKQTNLFSVCPCWPYGVCLKRGQRHASLVRSQALVHAVPSQTATQSGSAKERRPFRTSCCQRHKALNENRLEEIAQLATLQPHPGWRPGGPRSLLASPPHFSVATMWSQSHARSSHTHDLAFHKNSNNSRSSHTQLSQ
eukprot:1495699-Amphidinium_carterae.1